MASVAYAIDTALQSMLRSAALDGITSASIKIRSLPKSGETLDATPLIVISAVGTIDSAPFSMEGRIQRIYRRQVTVIDAMEGDYASRQDQHATWLELATQTIQKEPDGSLRSKLSGVPSVWLIMVERVDTFDRGKLAEDYSYQGIIASFYSME